jgi:predicted nucleotide-binding protein
LVEATWGLASANTRWAGSNHSPRSAEPGTDTDRKFEQHAAEASYAIIILTPDDKGSRADEQDTRPRSRQNVVFETGYFYGQIGRANVSVLLSPGAERRSDMDGIAYITLDDTGAWKEALFRELGLAST